MPSLIEVASLVALFAVLAVGVARCGIRVGLLAAVATLAFLQTPALKVLARWRLSDMLLWILGAFLLAKGWRPALRRLRSFPLRIRVPISGLVLYVTYTGLVGIIRAASSQTMARSPAVEMYFAHPLLRTLLESSRALAILILVLLLVLYAHDRGEVRKFMGAFVLGGVVSGAYGWYQAFAFESGAPLLPGTYQMGNARPAATFFEPTGFGSFAAVVSLGAASLANRAGSRWIVWLTAAGFAAATVQLSISRAAIAALVGGWLTSVMLTAKWGGARRTAATVALAAVVVAASLSGLQAARYTIGEDAVRAVYALPRIERDLRDRIVTDEFRRNGPGEEVETPPSLGGESSGSQGTGASTDPLDSSSPSSVSELSVMSLMIGVGQGNAVFLVGGAPGVLRLLAEAGFIGTVGLVVFHAGVVWNGFLLLRSHRRRDGTSVDISLVVGAYAATMISVLNYINTTDAWLWFMPGLLLASAAGREGVRRSSEATRGAEAHESAPLPS